MLRNWQKLPGYMKTEAVHPYYEILKKKERKFVLKTWI